MHHLFSPDSKFMQGLDRAADLLLLNFLFLLVCLPIFTVGSAVTALYSVTLAMGTPRERSACRGFFRALKENFRPALLLWLLGIGVCALLLLDILLFSRLGGPFLFGNVFFGILLLLAMLGMTMVFPLMSQFQNTVLGTLKNGLILALGNLPRAAAVLALWLFPAVLLVRMPLVFFYAAFLWIAVYFSAAAYLSGLLLKKVFQPYLPET